MTDHYMFADSPAALLLAAQVTVSLRRNGFKTRLVPVMVKGFKMYTLVATPPSRATRRERCASNAR